MNNASVIRDFDTAIRKAGGKFLRMTGRGHRRYSLGTMTIDMPTKGLEDGHMRKNIESEIKRALRTVKKESRHATKARSGHAKGKAAPSSRAQTHERNRRQADSDGRLSAETIALGNAQVAAAVVMEEEVLDGPHTSDAAGEASTPQEQVAALGVGTDGLGVADCDGRSPGSGRVEPSGPEVQERDVVGRLGSLEFPPIHGADTNTWPTCGREFKHAIHLGRHRTALHGAVSQRQKRLTAAGRATKTAPDGSTAPTKLMSPAPPGYELPRPILVAGTATMDRVVGLASQLAEAVRDLVTEYRLVRDENKGLTETLAAMEQAFGVMRSRR